MKKVFIMTPMLINDSITSDDINAYIRKASGAAEAIIGEEIEVETNFFLEPIGTDKDGETIMQVRNAYDEIAYMAEELSAMEKCDYIIVSSLPAPTPFSCAYNMIESEHFHMHLNNREVMALPIRVVEPPKMRIVDEFVTGSYNLSRRRKY